jgi:putative ABC transport system permease protein
LARRFGWGVGDEVVLTWPDGRQFPLAVRGLVRTGGDEERQVLVPLAWLQHVSERPGAFRRLQVSALVSPEDEFARRDPRSMTPAEFDRWYCSPYVSSVAHQIQEVLGDVVATPVHRVAQAETTILARVERLLAVVSIAALLGAVLAVLSTMTTTVLERRPEIALMKALGAANAAVGTLFVAEATLLGLLGGGLGYLGGLLGAQLISQSVFGAEVEIKPVLLPAMLVLACAVALLGTLAPLRVVQQTDPALVLKER